AIHAVLVVIMEAPGEGPLGALLAEHAVLLRGQARAPRGRVEPEALSHRRIGEALPALGVVLRLDARGLSAPGEAGAQRDEEHGSDDSHALTMTLCARALRGRPHKGDPSGGGALSSLPCSLLFARS